MNHYAIFLDDERFPVDGNWIICRSYEAFKDQIMRHGCPVHISFDHDLGSEETGLTCAKFLIDYWLVTGDIPEDFTFYVHSQNPIGKENIEKLLNRFLELEA